LLFPRDLAGYDGFKDYFYSRRRWFFGLLLAGQVIDVADTLLKGMTHFRSLGPSYLVSIVALSVLLVIAMRTRNERFHGALAIFAVVYLLAYPWLVFDTVG
jgi:hypothetical protein